MSRLLPIDIDSFIYENKLPVITSSQLQLRNGEMHPQGLFSKEIFGPVGSTKSRKQYAYIKLNVKIMHPLFFSILKKINRKLFESILLDNEYFYNEEKPLEIINSEQYKNIHNEEERSLYKSLYGWNDTIEYLRTKFRIKDIEKRPFHTRKIYEKFINYMTLQPNLFFIDKLIVIPLAFRPYMLDRASGQITGHDEINDLYLKIMRQNDRLKMSSNKHIIDTVIASIMKTLIDIWNLGKTKVAKKTGILRSRLLSKRVDFSGRSVIVGDPNLKTGEIGIPVLMAVNLFQPFIIHELLQFPDSKKKEYIEIITNKYKELGINTKDSFGKEIPFRWDPLFLKKFLQKFSKGIFQKDSKIYQEIKTIINKIILEKDLVVLNKRDPSLHRISWHASKVKLVDDNAIHIEQMETSSRNADFDGDSVIGNIDLIVKNKKTNKVLKEFKNVFIGDILKLEI